MKIGIIIFAYNRSRHLQKVLDGLRKNQGVSRIYIFQDGLKREEHRDEWEKTQQVVQNMKWCEVIYKLSSHNKGLAASIMDGVSAVFADNDAVIVLEDDCVPHPQFMEYMVKALEKYESYKEVYHIGASSEPAEAEPNGTDAYFLGRINSCGWGTWKDRWVQFSHDYKMLGRVKADAELNAWFNLWGQDLEAHILGNIYGTTDTWAAFWALTVIMKKGYCMSPYESFIDNIGFDGTGVHSGIAENRLKLRPSEKLTEIVLPDKVELVKDYRKSFAAYHRWTSPAVRDSYYKNVTLDMLELQHKKVKMTDGLKAMGSSDVCIWGRGRICDYLISEFDGEIHIKAIVETTPGTAVYQGIPVIQYKDIPQDISLVIVLPGYDFGRIENMVDKQELKSKLMPIDKLITKISVLFNEKLQP